MNKSGSIFISLLLTVFSFTVSAQTDKETALQKGKQAVSLEDEGKFDEALALLTDAQKLDPSNLTYPYEMTYCYYSRKEYQKTIDVLENIKDKPGSFDRIYQLLGNSYDMLGQSDKAINTYESGLKKFPKAGCLYLERGVIPLAAKDYNRAIIYFEKGIEAEPSFPSNYYWAAKLYLGSEEKLWGMIYGELFMNLERNSKRTEEISKLLYNGYQSGIKYTEPGKTAISFSKTSTISTSSIAAGGQLKLPFSMIYEPTMGIAAVTEKSIDLNSLDRIRQNFLKSYFQREFDKKYPNALFTYQDLVDKSGNIEAYNHWILMQGEPDAFNAWESSNKTKWDNFLKWFNENPLALDDNNHFIRWQYN
ncbi:tetratricopeptide repeat protein [Mucilaginibacter sp.]|uniref:tetratricopeptide repeat protein n=1 Tax=Mucilaginibacter sp. TaxID=1882438 RepID=UPI002ED02202